MGASKLENLPLPCERKLFFTEQVDQKSISGLVRRIVDINDNDDYLKGLYALHGITGYEPPPIEIFIDSYGGSVYQCFGLIGVMETSKTPIHTYVTGVAMSAGFIILIHGHYRYAYPHSTPLYHQVSSYSRGTLSSMEEDLEEYKRLQKKMEKMVLKQTKIPDKKLKEIYQRKSDWYMSPADALKYGVIDEIIK